MQASNAPHGILCRSSMTLGEMQSQLGVSTVLECDSTGNVISRAVALSNPTERLHTGKSYVPASYHRQRLAQRHNNNNSHDFAVRSHHHQQPSPPPSRPPVTFAGNVKVTEFVLPSPASPTPLKVGAGSAGFDGPSAVVDLSREGSFCVVSNDAHQRPSTFAAVFGGSTVAARYNIQGQERVCMWSDVDRLMQRDFIGEARAETQQSHAIIQRSLQLLDNFDRSFSATQSTAIPTA